MAKDTAPSGTSGVSLDERNRWTLLERAAFVGLLWFLGGGFGIALAAAVLVVVVLRPEWPRVLLLASAVLFAVVPMVLVLRGLPPAFFVSPLFVRDDLLPHYLAEAGLALLVIGTIRAVGLERREGAGFVVPELESEASTSDVQSLALGLPPSAVERLAALDRGGVRRGVSVFAVALVALAGLSFALRLAVSGGAVASPGVAEIASNLVAGRGFSISGPFGGTFPTALRMPAVPSLLALTGTAAAPAEAARALWALMGALTVVSVGVAGRRWFGATAGAVAAGLVAVLPVFWLRSARLDAATVAGLLLSVLLLLVAVRPGEPVGLGRVAAAGFVGGLLALTRPEGVVLAGAVLAVWVTGSAAVGRDAQARSLVALVAVAALLVPFGPWLLRNQGLLNTSLPTTEIGTLAAGSNAASAYSGGFIGSFDPAAVETTRTISSRPLGESALHARLLDAGWRYAVGHPVQLVPALGVRALRAFELWSPVNERAVHAARGLDVRGWIASWVSFMWLLGLAGVGSWMLRPRARNDLAPLFIAPAVVLVVSIVSFGEPLARAAIDPALALTAAWPITLFGTWVVRRLRARRAGGGDSGAEDRRRRPEDRRSRPEDRHRYAGRPASTWRRLRRRIRRLWRRVRRPRSLRRRGRRHTSATRVPRSDGRPERRG